MEMTMAGLNAVLFEMIERVNDDELHGEELEEQLKKAKLVGSISREIAHNVDLSLKAASMMERNGSMPDLGDSTRRLLGVEPVAKGVDA